MHTYLDKEQSIIAAGPVVKITEKLPSEPFDEWQANARAVIRHLDGKYESAVQILNDDGEHFEYQYALPANNLLNAQNFFAGNVQRLALQSFTQNNQEKPKQLARFNGKIVARTYDVEGARRPGDFALMFEQGFAPSNITHSIYRDNYFTLRKMVQRYYPGVEWLDAAQYAL